MKRSTFLMVLLLIWHTGMADTAAIPGSITLAKTIVSTLIAGKTPAEVLIMADQIAVALSEKNLCNEEAVQSMMDAGIPFDDALEAVAKACNLTGPRLSALTQSLAVGLPVVSGGPGVDGGPGAPVSP